ncbi:hypothetical protein L226DRAFT_68126 [Lentinus tigrinus ALCF2SS1-7]|uniref:Uncharacterized protein n=1 Tax=Lentinus tigrinus ALCF2SS1-6 TaxID=1328759 RepID=A0A5C2SFP8_9APHY|nr:hypothetical protein L227DRAFT_109033 [Lentinus tigrinus ALCF2SS1-6]RPD74892.1 hypothetical protein L226DRAFT_68126 [Lentinus tigrinus ALCF2SS1-7]
MRWNSSWMPKYSRTLASSSMKRSIVQNVDGLSGSGREVGMGKNIIVRQAGSAMQDDHRRIGTICEVAEDLVVEREQRGQRALASLYVRQCLRMVLSECAKRFRVPRWTELADPEDRSWSVYSAKTTYACHREPYRLGARHGSSEIGKPGLCIHAILLQVVLVP